MEALYTFLHNLGYDHPIHAPLTHVPIGMAVGAFLFILTARATRNESFTTTARHCTALALISLFPTALLGYMDWHHYYSGAWLPQIEKKILLAGLLGISLTATLGMLRQGRRNRLPPAILVTLNLILAGALGYFGGELVFKSLTHQKEVNSLTMEQGENLYRQHCAACHPHGGNSLKSHLPLWQAPQLNDVNTFVAYLRNPAARDGSATVMPAFPEEKLSREQASAILRHVKTNLTAPGK